MFSHPFAFQRRQGAGRGGGKDESGPPSSPSFFHPLRPPGQGSRIAPPRTKRSSRLYTLRNQFRQYRLLRRGDRGAVSPAAAFHPPTPPLPLHLPVSFFRRRGSVDRFLRTNRHDHKVTELFCFLLVGSTFLSRFPLIFRRSICRDFSEILFSFSLLLSFSLYLSFLRTNKERRYAKSRQKRFTTNFENGFSRLSR